MSHLVDRRSGCRATYVVECNLHPDLKFFVPFSTLIYVLSTCVRVRVIHNFPDFSSVQQFLFLPLMPITLYRNRVPVKVRPMEEQARESPGSSTLLQDAATTRRTPSFVPKLGAGIISDIRARAPWYFSDWTDAWNYRVIPATALIFFAKYVS